MVTCIETIVACLPNAHHIFLFCAESTKAPHRMAPHVAASQHLQLQGEPCKQKSLNVTAGETWHRGQVVSNRIGNGCLTFCSGVAWLHGSTVIGAQGRPRCLTNFTCSSSRQLQAKVCCTRGSWHCVCVYVLQYSSGKYLTLRVKVPLLKS